MPFPFSFILQAQKGSKPGGYVFTLFGIEFDKKKTPCLVVLIDVIKDGLELVLVCVDKRCTV